MPTTLERLLDQSRSGQGPYGRIWMSLVLIAWMERNRCVPEHHY